MEYIQTPIVHSLTRHFECVQKKLLVQVYYQKGRHIISKSLTITSEISNPELDLETVHWRINTHFTDEVLLSLTFKIEHAETIEVKRCRHLVMPDYTVSRSCGEQSAKTVSIATYRLC